MSRIIDGVFKCPVCEGAQKVLLSLYEIRKMGDTTRTDCRSCGGEGFIVVDTVENTSILQDTFQKAFKATNIIEP